MATVTSSVSMSLDTGGSISDSAAFATSAVTSVANFTVAMGATAQIDLQLGDLAQVRAFALRCNVMNGSVSVKGSGAAAAAFKITGPVILFGEAIGVVFGSLAYLMVDAIAATQDVVIDIIAAYDV
ncbi:MAG: hypothetical protein IPK81_18775 [Rhodospirillales bacterium]|nr:MAG: hypothetical protein IPK81_18775 [Rhodospirillales bacterium]